MRTPRRDPDYPSEKKSDELSWLSKTPFEEN
jgi:hypothetical protein